MNDRVGAAIIYLPAHLSNAKPCTPVYVKSQEVDPLGEQIFQSIFRPMKI